MLEMILEIFSSLMGSMVLWLFSWVLSPEESKSALGWAVGWRKSLVGSSSVKSKPSDLGRVEGTASAIMTCSGFLSHPPRCVLPDAPPFPSNSPGLFLQNHQITSSVNNRETPGFKILGQVFSWDFPPEKG